MTFSFHILRNLAGSLEFNESLRKPPEVLRSNEAFSGAVQAHKHNIANCRHG